MHLASKGRGAAPSYAAPRIETSSRNTQFWGMKLNFYRRKYDAAKVLEEFAATTRDETDLDRLTARLVEVVQETMQPAQVSLLLRKTDARQARQRTTDYGSGG